MPINSCYIFSVLFLFDVNFNFIFYNSIQFEIRPLAIFTSIHTDTARQTTDIWCNAHFSYLFYFFFCFSLDFYVECQTVPFVTFHENLIVSRFVLWCTHLWRYDEIRFNFMICQICFACCTTTRFNFKFITQIIQCSFRDMYTSVGKKKKKKKWRQRISAFRCIQFIKWMNNMRAVSLVWFIGQHKMAFTYPATPPLSMWFASVTSSLQTSNCHFLI